MLRIALPNKGRLNEECRELLNDAGLEVRSSNERALSASLGGEFEAIFVRAQDIPEFVADGAADAGITGWDLVAESGRELESRPRPRALAAAGSSSPPAKTAPFRSLEDIDGRPASRNGLSPTSREAFFAAGRETRAGRAGLRGGRSRSAPRHRRHYRRSHLDRFDPPGERAARSRDGAAIERAADLGCSNPQRRIARASARRAGAWPKPP